MTCECDENHDEENYCSECATCHDCLVNAQNATADIVKQLQQENAALKAELHAKEIEELESAELEDIECNEVEILKAELEAVKTINEEFREQLVCEACQYSEIFNYTNQGEIAKIAVDHKDRILKLLDKHTNRIEAGE